VIRSGWSQCPAPRAVALGCATVACTATTFVLRDERGAWKMAQILASDNGLS
jgi:hypothetical protein